MHREKRQGIDLVHDDVERTLIKVYTRTLTIPRFEVVIPFER